MVQFKPTFKPALLISSPAACTIFFDDMTRPWLLKNGIWYSRGERFPLFVLDGRIWYVSLNKVCYDVRGWERREDLLPYKVAKWPIFCLNRVDFSRGPPGDFWRLDPQRTSAGRQPKPLFMLMRDVHRSLVGDESIYSSAAALFENSITTKRIMRLVLEVNIPTFFL